jgi:methyl halide transferase
MLPTLDENYWTGRYDTGATEWDAGRITTPLKTYFDQLQNQELRILIPGAGNAHEAIYLWQIGFKHINILGLSLAPLKQIQVTYPDLPKNQLIHQDFFQHTGPCYDLIVEQTFFCALHPALRSQYAEKMADLLNPGGKLVGLLFDDELNYDKPPFGGNSQEYHKYFEPYFEFQTFTTCYNSIPPRFGREIFMILIKKGG